MKLKQTFAVDAAHPNAVRKMTGIAADGTVITRGDLHKASLGENGEIVIKRLEGLGKEGGFEAGHPLKTLTEQQAGYAARRLAGNTFARPEFLSALTERTMVAASAAPSARIGMNASR